MGPYTEQAQRLVCLLVALEEMPKVGPTKQEVAEYIQRRGYLKLGPEDVESYTSQTEPKWVTDIAFRRKDGVQNDLLFNNTRNSWELTRTGRDIAKGIMAACRSGRYDVRQCFLWNAALKKALCPGYSPSQRDAKRPPSRKSKGKEREGMISKFFKSEPDQLG